MTTVGRQLAPLGTPVGLYADNGTNQAVAGQPAQASILPTQTPQHVPGGARRPVGPVGSASIPIDPNGLYMEGRHGNSPA